MADEKSTNGEGARAPQAAPGGPATPEGARPQPSMQLVTQYVKDLSFENPGLGQIVPNPRIDLAVDLQARRVNDQGQYEVLLKMRANATNEDKPIFIVELAYGGMFVLKNVPDESLQPILLIEAPRLLFPFARRILADVVRDGGLPPLMIEPIDFVGLYRKKMGEPSGNA